MSKEVKLGPMPNKQLIRDDLVSLNLEDKEDLDSLRFYKKLYLSDRKKTYTADEAEKLVDEYRGKDALRFARTILYLREKPKNGRIWSMLVRNAEWQLKLNDGKNTTSKRSKKSKNRREA